MQGSPIFNNNVPFRLSPQEPHKQQSANEKYFNWQKHPATEWLTEKTKKIFRNGNEL